MKSQPTVSTNSWRRVFRTHDPLTMRVPRTGDAYDPSAWADVEVVKAIVARRTPIALAQREPSETDCLARDMREAREHARAQLDAIPRRSIVERIKHVFDIRSASEFWFAFALMLVVLIACAAIYTSRQA